MSTKKIDKSLPESQLQKLTYLLKKYVLEKSTQELYNDPVLRGFIKIYGQSTIDCPNRLVDVLQFFLPYIYGNQVISAENIRLNNLDTKSVTLINAALTFRTFLYKVLNDPGLAEFLTLVPLEEDLDLIEKALLASQTQLIAQEDPYDDDDDYDPHDDDDDLDFDDDVRV